MKQMATMMAVVPMAVSAMAVSSSAQTSSIGVKAGIEATKRVSQTPVRETRARRRNVVYDRYSWTTPTMALPRVFKVGDLLTIIVRERRRFSADAELETRKEVDLKSELDAFIKLTRGGLGAAEFQRGEPTIDYRYDNRVKGKADSQRQDSLTTRLAGKIIDVKPNGLLVLEAKARVTHDEEVSTITFTGTCRQQDVTADNTVLSTQVADKDISVDNRGALRHVDTGMDFEAAGSD